MRFHSLRVENFRRLVAPVDIDGFDDELTVIAGRNEEGKSTLLEAIRTALFDRYKLGGREAERLQPLGHKVAPEIEVGFSVNGERYSLWKRFCQRPAAELKTPDGALRDDAAEEALERLLGFRRPGRGASKPENQGIWGMLWVQQGQMFHGVSPADDARGSLHRALEAEVGQVLGGEWGQALLGRLEKTRTAYWTASAGNPTGEYRRAAERLATLRDRRDEIEQQLLAYEGRVDELARIRERLADYETGDTLGELSRQLEAASAEATEVEALRRRLEQAEADLALAAAHAENREANWQRRQAVNQRVEGLEQSIRGLEERRVAEEERLRAAVADAALARDGLVHAEEASETARQWRDRLSDAVQRRTARRRLHEMEQRLHKAEDARRAMAEARTAARSNAVDDDAIERLDARLREIETFELQLRAGATRVEFDVDRAVRAEGDCRSEEAGYLVTGRGIFHLDGVGRITVRAGGRELADVDRDLGRAREALESSLKDVSVDSVDIARRLHRERQTLIQEEQAQGRLLQAHAPDGIDSLAAECERLRFDEGTEREAPDLPESETELARGVANAKDALANADRALAQARRQVEEARSAESRATNTLTEITTRWKAEGEELDRFRSQLADEREQASDDALYRELAEGRSRLVEARRHVTDHNVRLEAADPEMVAIRVKRSERAVREAERDLAELERRAATLDAELHAVGQQGLGEELEAVRADLSSVERHHALLHRQANAARVAHQAVAAAAADARQTFLGPVSERVSVYLKSLLPEAELVLDDRLEVQGLRRAGVEEPFGSLSVGTREQLAVITRFAFADLLAEEGSRIPVLLDDALVYADEERFSRMRDVIARAAERHQVIVLTCHESAYRGVGGRLIRLADSVRRSAG